MALLTNEILSGVVRRSGCSILYSLSVDSVVLQSDNLVGWL